jgi:UDP-2-acetamido-2,6-beta-L-arabino-hexul-4-ose reductase
VNRPEKPEDFQTGNAGFTSEICENLVKLGRRPCLVLSSSIQAALDNAYGQSKRGAETAVESWARQHEASAVIFRLKNVFGKWCRPNYNSVTATFCHNIAHDLPITISDPNRELDLVYIDHVIEAMLGVLDQVPKPGIAEYREVSKSFRTTLGDLAARIRSFRESRRTLRLPTFEDEFTRCLYATYLSYLDGPEFSYRLEAKHDPRGSLAEFMKSEQFGQIFVSRTKPGITRGNHYHHTKTEKFLVLEGEAVIRFRHIDGKEIIEHQVSGAEYRVLDIPPGYTHSIENVGTGEMVVLFWASEIFDPARPDTIALPVKD